MHYEVYKDYNANSDFSIFEFASEGRHGVILKRIEFTATEYKDVYNLAFGDIGIGDEMNDSSISDNGDRNKIFATILDIVVRYTSKYPDRLIFFTGNSMTRNRLYRMAIGLNLDYLLAQFDIYTLHENKFVVFRKNLEVTIFLVKRKNM